MGMLRLFAWTAHVRVPKGVRAMMPGDPRTFVRDRGEPTIGITVTFETIGEFHVPLQRLAEFELITVVTENGAVSLPRRADLSTSHCSNAGNRTVDT